MSQQITFSILFLCFVHITFSQSDAFHSLGSPFITNYTAKEYLDAGKNWHIGQAKDGRMYFANNYGLVQFDGYEWVRVGQPLNQSEIRSFYIHNDKMFIGGTSEIGYFKNGENGNLAYHLLNELIPESDYRFTDVTEIAAFKDEIYFLTDNGILLYANDTITILGKGMPFQTATSSINNLIIASNTNGLFKIENQTLLPLQANLTLENISFEFLLAVKPEAYLLGTERKGILLFENGQVRPWNADNQAIFKESHLTQAILLNKKNLIFGSLQNGLLVTDYQGNILKKISEKDGLLDLNILSIYKDQSDNIWASVDGSVAQIELNSPFTILNKKNDLRGEIFCMLKKGTFLYVGTSRGLFKAYWDTKSRSDIHFSLIPQTTGQCWALYEHDNDILLAHDNGVYQIKDDKAQYIGGNGHWNFVELPGNKNVLLSGHYTGISLLEKTASGYELKYNIEGFTETAREIAIEGQQIWVPQGYQGIYKLQLANDLQSFKEVKLYDTQKGLPSNLYNMLLKVDDKLLFGTQNGVYQYNAEHDQMELDPFFQDILGDQTLIRVLYKMPDGNYFSIKNYDRNDEIALIEVLEDGSHTLTNHPFQKLRGHLIPAFESILFLEDRFILIGGKEGLIIYDAQQSALFNKGHECFISQVSIPVLDSVIFSGNLENINQLENEIQLNSGVPLTFEYASTFFESIPFTQYSTYLEGMDHQWQDWSDNNSRTFNNLPAGLYTFWVKSKNIYDIEGSSASFTFRVKRPIEWQNSLGVFAVLLFLVLAYFIFSRRRRVQKQTHYKQLKEELNLKNTEINQINHTKSKLEEEVNLINQKLSSSILKNQIHAGLIQKIEQLAQNDASPKKLNNALSDFHKDLKELDLQLSAQQSIETQDFISKIKVSYPDLTARELRLCSYLKLNVSSKEIAQYLGISLRGVESLRYRLRKKLGLKTGQDLTEFIIKL
ncbi:MAG: triple tyrosine motif-containing protein [Bacteroidota bacterium]